LPSLASGPSYRPSFNIDSNFFHTIFQEATRHEICNLNTKPAQAMPAAPGTLTLTCLSPRFRGVPSFLQNCTGAPRKKSHSCDKLHRAAISTHKPGATFLGFGKKGEKVKEKSLEQWRILIKVLESEKLILSDLQIKNRIKHETMG